MGTPIDHPPAGRATARRSLAIVALTAALATLLPAPTLARPAFSEDQVVAAAGRQVVHLRIQTGCGDLPTDRFELTIPASVLGVVPEAAEGWAVETVVEPTDPYDLFGVEQTDRVTAIRWTGGSVPVGQYREVGIAAVFTETGRTEFRVVQGCGDREVVFDREPADGGASGEADAASLRVVAERPPVDIVVLRDDLNELRDVVRGLRAEVDDARLPRIIERLDMLGQRLRVMEQAAGVKPLPATGEQPVAGG